MAKKTVGVSLRKPPPPADLIDAYVGQDAAEKTPTSGLHALRRTAANEEVMVTSAATGRAFRELTLYVPQDLAQKLGVHCAEQDRDMSNVVVEAVAKMLEPKPAEVEVEVELPKAKTGWEKARGRFEGAISILRARLRA
jgi:hypothetical protein